LRKEVTKKIHSNCTWPLGYTISRWFQYKVNFREKLAWKSIPLRQVASNLKTLRTSLHISSKCLHFPHKLTGVFNHRKLTKKMQFLRKRWVRALHSRSE
jgi:hypothetical protein